MVGVRWCGGGCGGVGVVVVESDRGRCGSVVEAVVGVAVGVAW